MTITFEIIKESSKNQARAGILHTKHGSIPTPVFMPVGTQGTVKSLTPDQLSALSCDIILSNTYHLFLRPGPTLIQSCGGLHTFMNWQKPILTDSGGFQVFSLSKLRKISKEGVIFKSHIDGSKHKFTPKNVIDFQRQFGSDIMMPLDVCSPYPATEKQIESDLLTTHQWEIEAFQYWQRKQNKQLLFAIVQGGMHKAYRKQSVETLTQYDFPGFAIGGLSVGEPFELFKDILAFTAPLLPKQKPRYVMGIGLPENLEFAMDQGIDMFDCVLPTRLARHGQIFVKNNRVNIKRNAFKTDLNPIDPQCQCYACTNFSSAYIRHLFMSKEMLASTLMSIHNIHTLIQFVKCYREAILKG